MRRRRIGSLRIHVNIPDFSLELYHDTSPVWTLESGFGFRDVRAGGDKYPLATRNMPTSPRQGPTVFSVPREDGLGIYIKGGEGTIMGTSHLLPRIEVPGRWRPRVPSRAGSASSRPGSRQRLKNCGNVTFSAWWDWRARSFAVRRAESPMKKTWP